jgi:hypothetical protein
MELRIEKQGEYPTYMPYYAELVTDMHDDPWTFNQGMIIARGRGQTEQDAIHDLHMVLIKCPPSNINIPWQIYEKAKQYMKDKYRPVVLCDKDEPKPQIDATEQIILMEPI